MGENANLGLQVPTMASLLPEVHPVRSRYLHPQAPTYVPTYLPSSVP